MKDASETSPNPKDAPGTRRIIRTARTEEKINEATASGGSDLERDEVRHPF